jgi:hypothetical protein
MTPRPPAPAVPRGTVSRSAITRSHIHGWEYPERVAASCCTLVPATVRARTTRGLARLIATTACLATESRRPPGQPA